MGIRTDLKQAWEANVAREAKAVMTFHRTAKHLEKAEKGRAGAELFGGPR
jgi:hypothetical protein